MSTNATEQVTYFVNSAFHASPLTYAAIGIGVFMAAFLFKLFFKDFADFGECVRYCLRPDIISWFRGESVEDAWSEMKLFVWVALATGSGIVSYHQIPGWFPGFFGR